MRVAIIFVFLFGFTAMVSTGHTSMVAYCLTAFSMAVLAWKLDLWEFFAMTLILIMVLGQIGYMTKQIAVLETELLKTIQAHNALYKRIP